MVCIIVRRGDFQQYNRLHQAFGERVPVVWDRRRRTAPSAKGDHTATQRDERRQPPPLSWVALGFVVVNRPTE